MGDIINFSDILKNAQVATADINLTPVSLSSGNVGSTLPQDVWSNQPSEGESNVAGLVPKVKLHPIKIPTLDMAAAQAKKLRESGQTVQITMQDIEKYFPDGDPAATARALKDKGYQVKIPAYWIMDLTQKSYKDPAEKWGQFFNDYNYLKNRGYTIDDTHFETPEDHMMFLWLDAKRRGVQPNMTQYKGTRYEDMARAIWDRLNNPEKPIENAPPPHPEGVIPPDQEGLYNRTLLDSRYQPPDFPNTGMIHAAPLSDEDKAKVYQYAEQNGLAVDKMSPLQIADAVDKMTSGQERFEALYRNLPAWDHSYDDSIAGTVTPLFQRGSEAIANVAGTLPNAAVKLATIGNVGSLEQALGQATGAREPQREIGGLQKSLNAMGDVYNGRGTFDENAGKVLSGVTETGMDALAFAGPGAPLGYAKFVAVDEVANVLTGERPVSKLLQGVGQAVSDAAQSIRLGPEFSSAIGGAAALVVLHQAMSLAKGKGKGEYKTVSVKDAIDELIKAENNPDQAAKLIELQKALDAGGVQKVADAAINNIDNFLSANLRDPRFGGRNDLADKIDEIRNRVQEEYVPPENGELIEPRRYVSELNPDEQAKLAKLRSEAMNQIESILSQKGVVKRTSFIDRNPEQPLSQKQAKAYLEARSELARSRIAQTAANDTTAQQRADATEQFLARARQHYEGERRSKLASDLHDARQRGLEQTFLGPQSAIPYGRELVESGQSYTVPGDLAPAQHAVEGKDYTVTSGLTPGDKFTSDGEAYHVKGYDPKSGELIVKDGVTYRLDPRKDVVQFDQGSLKRTSKQTPAEQAPIAQTGAAEKEAAKYFGVRTETPSFDYRKYPSDSIIRMAAAGDSDAISEQIRRGIPTEYQSMPLEKLQRLAGKGDGIAVSEMRRRGGNAIPMQGSQYGPEFQHEYEPQQQISVQPERQIPSPVPEETQRNLQTEPTQEVPKKIEPWEMKYSEFRASRLGNKKDYRETQVQSVIDEKQTIEQANRNLRNMLPISKAEISKRTTTTETVPIEKPPEVKAAREAAPAPVPAEPQQNEPAPPAEKPSQYERLSELMEKGMDATKAQRVLRAEYRGGEMSPETVAQFYKSPDRLRQLADKYRTIAREAKQAHDKLLLDIANGKVGANLQIQALGHIVKWGAYHIAAGVADFTAWSADVISRFGEKVRPHLKELWEKSQRKAKDITAADSKMFMDKYGQTAVEGKGHVVTTDEGQFHFFEGRTQKGDIRSDRSLYVSPRDAQKIVSPPDAKHEGFMQHEADGKYIKTSKGMVLEMMEKDNSGKDVTWNRVHFSKTPKKGFVLVELYQPLEGGGYKVATVNGRVQDVQKGVMENMPLHSSEATAKARYVEISPYDKHVIYTKTPEQIEKLKTNEDYTAHDLGGGKYKFVPVDRRNDTGEQALQRTEQRMAEEDKVSVDNAKKNEEMKNKNNTWQRFKQRIIYSAFRTSESAEGPLEHVARSNKYTPEVRSHAESALNAIGHVGFAHEASSVALNKFYDISHELRDNGIDEKDFNTYIAFNRGINDKTRSDVLTYGYTPEVLQRGLEALKNKIGEEKYNKIKELQERAAQVWHDEVLSPVHDSGLISDKSYEEHEGNKAYAPFQHEAPVREVYDKVFGNGAYDEYARQIMKESGGSIGVSKSPFTEMIVKASAYTHAALENNARRLVGTSAKEITDFLKKNPEVIEKPKYQLTGLTPKGEHGIEVSSVKGQGEFPLPPKDSGLDLMEYYDNGEKKGVWIDKEVADHFNDKAASPAQKIFQWSVIRTVNSFQRQVLTSRNPFFIFTNFPKDVRSSLTQNKDMRLLVQKNSFGKLVVRNFFEKDVRDFVKSGGKVVSPRIQDAMKRGLLSERVQFDINPADSDSMMMAMAKDAYLENALQQSAGMKLWETLKIKLGAANVRSEMTVKLAGKEWYELHYPEMSQDYRDYRVREYVGTPNGRQRGKYAAVVDNIFMFSNMGFQGWRAAFKNLKQDPVSFSVKQLQYSIFPNAIKWMTYYGVLTQAAKHYFPSNTALQQMCQYNEDALKKVGKHNLEMYYVIPSPWGFDDNGKAVIARIPMGHFDVSVSTFIGEMAKNVEDEVKSGHGFALGAAKSAFPSALESGKSNFSLGLNPVLDIALTYLQAAGGENPKDRFYNTDVFRRKTFTSHEAGRKAGELAKWTLGKTPIVTSMIYNPTHSSEEAHPSLPDYLASFPIFQKPLFNYAVTDAGEKEEAAAYQGRVEAEKAQKSLALDDFIQASIDKADASGTKDYRQAANDAWQEARENEGLIPPHYRYSDFVERYTNLAAADEPKLKVLPNIPKDKQDDLFRNIGEVNSGRVETYRSFGRVKIRLRRE